jgi:uncharacterized protein involved in exopolysaccharide biosynthesis
MAQELTPVNTFYPASAGRAEVGEAPETTKQILFVLFKWRRLMLAIFAIFTIAAAVAMYMLPPVRSATAKILIRVDRMPMQISGLAPRLDRSQISQIMNSEVQLMKSREVLSAVAMTLLANPHRDEGVDPETLEAKISELEKNTSAVPLADANVLEVTHYAETSEEAQQALAAIIGEYIEKQAAIQSGSTKLLKFYEQEKQRVEAELRIAEDDLNKWQGSNDTVSIDQQITSQLELLEDRRKALQQTEAHLEATQAKVASVTTQLKAQPERLVMGQEQIANPVASKLAEQVIAAETALQDLMQRFTEKHRTVQEKQEQIAYLKKELAAADTSILGRETTALNPLRENLKQQLAESQALATSLSSQKQIVGKQVRDISTHLGALREKKVKIDELSRMVDLRKDAFMLYGKKLEEGRIATGLGKEQLANLSVIAAPHATDETDLKKRVRMVLLSAFVGLAVGMAIAFGLEFFNNSLRTRQDVEYYLGLPVLAAIPDLQGTRLLNDQRG